MTMGWLGDFWGRERVYLLGLAVFTFPLALTALSSDIYQVIAWRAVQGIGSAMILATSMAIIADVFSPRERGVAFGLVGMVVGIGLGSGPLLGGIILDVLDWSALFYTRIPLGLFAVIITWALLKRSPKRTEPLHLDIAGSLLLLIVLGSFLLAITQAGRLGLASPVVIGAILVGVLGLPLLLFQERSAIRPIINLHMFRNPMYSGGVVALLGLYQSWNSVGFLLPFVMINALGYTGTKAGAILAIFSLVRSVASPGAGWLSNKLPHRLLMGLGMVILASCLFLISTFSLGVIEWQLALILAVASIGCALFDPTNSASMMSTVPQDRLGMAAATIATSRQIGLAGGIAISGAILASRQIHHLESLGAGVIASDHIAKLALIHGASDALVTSGVFCLLTVLPLILWKRKSNPPTQSR